MLIKALGSKLQPCVQYLYSHGFVHHVWSSHTHTELDGSVLEHISQSDKHPIFVGYRVIKELRSATNNVLKHSSSAS